MKPVDSGLLIAIEGIDGSGKSLLSHNLFTALKARDTSVIITKEPGGTPVGEKLYKTCINQDYNLTPKAEFLLFATSRAEHFDKVVIPHLEKNYIVISDRMSDSSLVYQGYAQGLDLQMLNTINNWVMCDIKPALTLYVKIDLTTACKRITNRSAQLDIFEQKQAFLEKSIAGFNMLYQNRNDVVILDGTQTPEELTKIALEHIIKLLPSN